MKKILILAAFYIAGVIVTINLSSCSTTNMANTKPNKCIKTHNAVNTSWAICRNY